MSVLSLRVWLWVSHSLAISVALGMGVVLVRIHDVDLMSAIRYASIAFASVSVVLWLSRYLWGHR